MPDELLTTHELAARLKVTAATIRSWVAKGLIPVVRINRHAMRFDWEAVLHSLRLRHPSRSPDQ